MDTLGIVTNASANDADRLRLTIPHWLSVFGRRLTEIVIVLDEAPPTGRIAKLHGNSDGESFSQRLANVVEIVEYFRRKDSRVKLRKVPKGPEMDEILIKWFGPSSERIDRCQAGTPIAPFIAAFEASKTPTTLRVDCDMLLYDNGWVEYAIKILESGHFDLIEPPRCGGGGDGGVSTRALMLARNKFDKVLPIEPAQLDFLRRIHRNLIGRSTYLALEQMLDKAIRGNKINYCMLSVQLGFTLHIAKREQASLPIMKSVVSSVERGYLPLQQKLHGHDFFEDAWQN
jgi:hypothetical protein